MGGRYRNNIGGRVKNKTKFLSSYKFSLAMEIVAEMDIYQKKYFNP